MSSRVFPQLSADEAERALCGLPHVRVGYYSHPRVWACLRCHVEDPELRYPGPVTPVYPALANPSQGKCVGCGKPVVGELAETARQWYRARVRRDA